MSLLVFYAQEIIRVQRDFKCCAGFNCLAGFDHCAMELRVEAPVGQTVGYVKQQYVHPNILQTNQTAIYARQSNVITFVSDEPAHKMCFKGTSTDTAANSYQV